MTATDTVLRALRELPPWKAEAIVALARRYAAARNPRDAVTLAGLIAGEDWLHALDAIGAEPAAREVSP